MVTTPRENIKNSKQKHSNRTLSCGETPSTDKKLGLCIEYHGFCPSTPIIMGGGGGGLNLMPKFCGDKIFSYIFGGINLCGELKVYGRVIFIAALSLFYSETANTHKSKIFLFKNFFRKCEYLRSYYLPITSNLLK